MVTTNQALFNDLREIATDLDPVKFNWDISHINNNWDKAKQYNKLQNRELKDNPHSNITIKSFEAKDERTNEVRRYYITADKKMTRKEWYKFIVCETSNFTIQEINKILGKNF